MTERIQQRRTKGWRKPENTVSVARPSKWGNPFRVRRVECSLGGFCYQVEVGDRIIREHLDDRVIAHRVAVDLFRAHLVAFPMDEEDLEPLRGKNLMCWCPMDVDCHASVLLQIANGDDYA